MSLPTSFIHTPINKDDAVFGTSSICIEPTDAGSAIDAGNYKSWLCVAGSPTPEQCPSGQIQDRGLVFNHIPLEVSTDLTRANAMRIIDAMRSMPSPIMIQCATANRASAVVALYVGATSGWTSAQTLEWARGKELKFIGTQSLRNWVASSLTRLGETAPMTAIFRQLFEPVSSTYTYLLADPETREAILIDPVDEKAERDATLAKELGLNLTKAINTHVHADHVTGTYKLRNFVHGIQSGVAAVSGGVADFYYNHGDKIQFGNRYITAVSTPGHTNGCTSFIMDDESAVFTGDAVLIRGCGRTDFQQGNSETLYTGVHKLIFSLPDTCVIYPGHDYNGHQRSTVGEENALNARLGYGRTLEDFKGIMAGLNLPPPKLLDVALPANLRDGAPAPAPAEEKA